MFVFAEGDPPEGFHFVLEGRVRVFRGTPDGHEQTLQVVERGGLMAVACFAEGLPYPASAATMLESDEGSIPNAELSRLCHAHGALSWRLLAHFARRLLWAQGRIYDFALRSAGGRVAAAMLQLGRAGPDGCLTVDIPLTHREIGELVGVSRETATRALRELRQASAVRWTEHGLLILDPARLEGWQRGGGGA